MNDYYDKANFDLKSDLDEADDLVTKSTPQSTVISITCFFYYFSVLI